MGQRGDVNESEQVVTIPCEDFTNKGRAAAKYEEHTC